MVLCEICEDGRVELYRARAMLDEPVAGDFHRDRLVSRIEHSGEEFLKVK